MTVQKTGYPFKDALFEVDPFDEIELDGIEVDMQGWGSNAGIFEQVIKHIKPLTIIELGTWKGASAIHMANLCKKYELQSQILCVDNWNGFPSFYFRKEQAHEEFKIKGGRPRLFETFMKNVIDADHQDMITPLVMQTSQAAQVVKAKNIRADLMYIDGDHSYEGCKADLADFAHLLDKDGVILCDDFQWEGARQAIEEHRDETGCELYGNGNKAILSYGRDISEIVNFMDEITQRRLEMEERKRKAVEES